MISAGEQKVASYLQQRGIEYKSQFSCETLRTCNNGFYKFDFAILGQNHSPIGMIEFNGKQHYISSDFFGAVEEIQTRDNNKIEWCKACNIPLLIIPYYFTDNEIYSALEQFIKEVAGGEQE